MLLNLTHISYYSTYILFIARAFCLWMHDESINKKPSISIDCQPHARATWTLDYFFSFYFPLYIIAM